MRALLLRPLSSPPRVVEDGVVRVGGTRVTLDTLVGCYRDGSTAEEVVLQYPTLPWGDVQAAIAYYLLHQREVAEYLQLRSRDAADARQRVEQVCDPRGIRDRLLIRRRAR